MQASYAQFRTVNYSRLLLGDATEIAELLSACTEDGFFYLDLGGKETETLLADWKKILAVIDEWFDRPLEEKLKHHHNTVKYG
jgi:isopenicillin N synthase-like dioxygenase